MSISGDESINKENSTNPKKKKTTIISLNPLILKRWSPRSMTGETLDNETIMSLLEAARWSPS